MKFLDLNQDAKRLDKLLVVVECLNCENISFFKYRDWIARFIPVCGFCHASAKSFKEMGCLEITEEFPWRI